MSRYTVAVCAVGLLVGCSDSTENAAEQGASVVRGTSTIGIVPTEVANPLGCAACEGTAAITPIAIAAGPDGSVYVIDSFEPFIRAFGREGDPMLAIGVKGHGPPDFKRPIAVYPLENGIFWVHDGLPPGRLLELSASGEILSTIELGQQVLNLADMDPSRRFFYTVEFERGVGPVVPTTALARLVRWEVSQARAPVRLFAVEEPDPTTPAAATERRNRRWSVAVSPNGEIAVGYIHEYTIKIVGVDGRLKAEVRRDLPAELDPRGRRKPYFPAAGLDFAADGRLWVQRFRGNTDATSTVFDVFDVDHSYVGEVEIPRLVLEQQAKAFDLVDNALIAITLDDETGERVVSRWDLGTGTRR